jgi:hypothetical protein
MQYYEKQEQPFCSMATVHPQAARTCLPKLACSALVASLLCTAMFISGAYPQSDLVDKLLHPGKNNQTNATTNRSGPNQGPTPNPAISTTDLETIQSNSQSLQMQLEQALAKIEQNIQKNKDLTERISRSPRAIKTVQALEVAIAIFGQNKPKPEYEVSEYASGRQHWRHSPAQHPVPIQDLLLYDVQNKHNQNKILGDKVAEVIRQNIHLAQQASSAYETPSEKLKNDPIMGLVTKTVATYMFL